MTPLALAAGLAAAAVWAGTAGSGSSRRLGAVPGLGPAASDVGEAWGVGEAWRAAGPAARVAAAIPWPVAVAAAGLLVAVAAGAAAGAATAVLAAAGVRARRAGALRARDDRLRAGQLAVCEALAAELGAGRPAVPALRAAAGAVTGEAAWLAARAAGIAELGGDVAAVLGGPALARGSSPPGEGPAGERSAPGAPPDVFVRLAACWGAAARSGGGLAAGVERLAAGLRAEERQRAELAGELAGARATARLLAVLPALGLLLGAAVGAAPVPFLLTTRWGACCLLGAVLLDLAGLAWTERIAGRAAVAAGGSAGPSHPLARPLVGLPLGLASGRPAPTRSARP